MELNQYLLPEERCYLQRKLIPVQRCLNVIQALRILRMGDFHSVYLPSLLLIPDEEGDHCCQL